MRISRCLPRECAFSRQAFGAMLDGGAIFPADLPDVNEKDVPMSTIDRLAQARQACGVRYALACSRRCAACVAPPDSRQTSTSATCVPRFFLFSRAERGSVLTIEGHTVVRTLFLFKYAYPVDHFIRALKFRGERVFARVLGELRAREHRSRGWEPPDCIVPMPLHVAPCASADSINRWKSRDSRRPRWARASNRAAWCDGSPRGSRVAWRWRRAARTFSVPLKWYGPCRMGASQLLDDVVTTGSTRDGRDRCACTPRAREIELWGIARSRWRPGVATRGASAAKPRFCRPNEARA